MPDHRDDIKLAEDQIVVLKGEIAELERTGKDDDHLAVLHGHLVDTKKRLEGLKRNHVVPVRPATATNGVATRASLSSLSDKARGVRVMPAPSIFSRLPKAKGGKGA